MTLDAEALKAWLLFSFSLGCWTLLTLLVSQRGERRGRLTMAAFVALLLLPPLQAYVALARGAPLPWLEALSYKLTWAYGPLMLLCVRQALLLPTAPGRRVWLHALPLLPIWTGALMGADWVGRPVVVWLLLAQVLIYAGCGLLLLRRQRGRLVQLAQRHRNTSYYWLLYLALGLFAATCFDLVINALAQKGRLPPQALLQGAAMVLALYVDLIALFAVYQPEIFVAEPPTAEPAPDAELPKPAVARAVELSPEVARELSERLERLVQQHKPHQDEDMSLARLAALLDVTGHQLSELLNLHLGRSFYDYLNELRYREALQMLERPDPAQTLTVADIAYRAGFNNRNSFHKVFKDKTGLTPAQYRKAWRKQA